MGVKREDPRMSSFFGVWTEKSCPSPSFFLAVGGWARDQTVSHVQLDSVAEDVLSRAVRGAMRRGDRLGSVWVSFLCGNQCVQCCSRPPNPNRP